MSIEILDRDAIFANAIEIASPEERDAYIARACGGDAALRREVEEMVAAHLQAGGAAEKPAGGALLPPGRAGARQAEGRAGQPRVPSTPHPQAGARSYPRGSVAVAGLLLLAIAAGACGLAVWAWQGEEKAQAAAHEAAGERDKARQEAEEAKKQHEQGEAERQALATARDEAVAASRAAQHSAEDTRAVLAFFQDKVLAAGRRKDWGGGLPKDWARGQGKGVSLRQAVDAAEPEVAKAFADRPLAEASVRELLGAAYEDLEEPNLAVKQFQRALTLREELLGTGHPDTIACRNKLAVALRHADREKEASQLYDQGSNSPSRAAEKEKAGNPTPRKAAGEHGEPENRARKQKSS